VEFGNIKWIERLFLLQCPRNNPRVLNSAFRSANSLAVVQCLRRHSCPWSSETFADAVKSNASIHLLEWMRQENCPWDATVLNQIIKHGDYTIMQWAATNKCPWDNTSTNALFKYWKNNGCDETVSRHILDWAKTISCQRQDIDFNFDFSFLETFLLILSTNSSHPFSKIPIVATYIRRHQKKNL
jgi:hypothetical protein